MSMAPIQKSRRSIPVLTMLVTMSREQGESSGTRITPIPYPGMPLSAGIEVLAQELEGFSVNAGPLASISPRITSLATCAARSHCAGDIPRTMKILQDTGTCLWELILILKWMRIAERDRIPWVVMEHMAFVQQIAEGALEEIRQSLPRYSGRA